MNELLITFVIVCVVVIVLWWCAGKLPAPMSTVAQFAVIAGGCLWLITHIRSIIHAIAGT